MLRIFIFKLSDFFVEFLQNFSEYPDNLVNISILDIPPDVRI